MYFDRLTILCLLLSPPAYMRFVTRWFDELLMRIKPFMYANGGPVVMLQIENEYGSYFACDHVYTAALRDQVIIFL